MFRPLVRNSCSTSPPLEKGSFLGSVSPALLLGVGDACSDNARAMKARVAVENCILKPMVVERIVGECVVLENEKTRLGSLERRAMAFSSDPVRTTQHIFRPH